MSVYFDASVISALFVTDGFSRRAQAYIEQAQPTPIMSDFAAAEFASTVNKYMRMGILPLADCRAALAAFDRWRDVSTTEAATSSDIALADRYLRRLDLNLRTGDAIHLAIVARLGAPLVTFDERMAGCAISLGLPVISA